MSVAAEKIAEVPALPERDRAYLARELIASLGGAVDGDTQTDDELIRDISTKLNTPPKAS